MKTKKILLTSLICLLTLGVSSCSPSKLEGTSLEANFRDDNYRTFYEIFVGGFSDSNNDGLGDINGIINRMDYLNDGNLNSGESLGVTGFWLMPIMPSPSYHKYDVKDYKDIDPKYGTLNDFKKLSKICDQRNVKLIIDMVLNHSSNEHPWFINATNAIKNNDMDNEYISYYSIVHENELNDVRGRVFYQIGETDYYYEGNFSPYMPELNYDNPKVKEEMIDVAKFWIDLGVDGFRLDAVKYIYMNQDDKTIEFLKWYLEECRKIKDDFYIVGEDWSNEQHIINYYQAINCFDFTFSEINGEFCSVVRNISTVTNLTNKTQQYLSRVKESNSDAILHPFLSNHDMDRVGGYMGLKNGYAFMASNLYLLSPGNPYLYYGEEIAMKGSRGLASTDANRRLAMLWGDGDTVSDPEGTTYDKNLQVNGTVKSHLEDENSLLNHYKKLIQIRNAYPEIARGEYHSIETDNHYFGGFYSSYNDSIVGVFHNTSKEEISVDLSKYTNIDFKDLKVSVGLSDATYKNNVLTIGGYTSVVMK